MYVCMYVCMYVRTYVCMHACNACMQACMHACIYVYTYVFVYVYVFTCMHVFLITLFTCAYVSTCITRLPTWPPDAIVSQPPADTVALREKFPGPTMLRPLLSAPASSWELVIPESPRPQIWSTWQAAIMITIVGMIYYPEGPDTSL